MRSVLFEDAERAGMAAVANDVRDADASGETHRLPHQQDHRAVCRQQRLLHLCSADHGNRVGFLSLLSTRVDYYFNIY